MSTTRETERAELHKTIWRIANDLRGAVDGWDFKSYVLGILFYRFISENLTAYLNLQERKAGDKVFDYAALSDKQARLGREETVREKGFYILPSQLFANVRRKARQDANLNETLSKVFKAIEASSIGSDSEDDFKGLFDDLDVNSSRAAETQPGKLEQDPDSCIVPEEQARIVAILDRFDALVTDLSIGLPAELEARRQQYEYNRDRLLTFREAA
ncbi:MAG TPA: type I restriction-modification system subunit M N-terminal domain-containing protein [Gemmatimonadaceae bacterium]|nr:type I restriction-modification system subunit M N-terminal domain-containing protein [Gemmatimonadaceae bacterium]